MFIRGQHLQWGRDWAQQSRFTAGVKFMYINTVRDARTQIPTHVRTWRGRGGSDREHKISG